MSTAANPYTTPDATLESGVEPSIYDPDIFSFSGRIGRMRYIAYMFGTYICWMILMFIAVMVTGATSALAVGDISAFTIPVIVSMGLGYLALIVFWTMYGKRRLNDLNRSGWWVLIYFVPTLLSFINPMLGLLAILSIPLAIYMIFFPGKSEGNSYGPPPSQNSTGVLILAGIAIAFTVLGIVGIVAAIAIPQMAGMPQ